MTATRSCVALLILLVAPIHARQAPGAINVTRLGPQVGERVPDFRLSDQHGKVWNRDSIMGPNGAMLVFGRSLDWCPFCKTQVAELQTRAADLTARGLGLAFVTYDPPAVTADFSRRRSITFPLLSDPGSRTIRNFGILNTTVAPSDTRSYGIPFPGTFLLDRSGRVTSRFFEETHRERNTVSTILLTLGASGATTAATRIQTEHLEVTTFLSDDVVAPGSLFSVVFDITPAPGIHVYAPGATGYRVVRFAPTMQPRLEALPAQYPASEIYFFKPLNERVPVFQKPFRLTQRMGLGTSPEDREALARVTTLTVGGMLEYQACSDTLCYNPRSIPVSHTVRLRQLDTELPTTSR